MQGYMVGSFRIVQAMTKGMSGLLWRLCPSRSVWKSLVWEQHLCCRVLDATCGQCISSAITAALHFFWVCRNKYFWISALWVLFSSTKYASAFDCFLHKPKVKINVFSKTVSCFLVISNAMVNNYWMLFVM